jgi:peptide-methionine (R)-S-oxide reductase
MFESDLERDEAPVRTRRRAFLLTSASAMAGLLVWSLRKPRFVQATSKESPQEVAIVQFSDSGERLETVRVQKVVKTDDEWRKQLSPGAFAITRHADTEIAYTGQYRDLHEKGLYRCICCGNALFSSDTKFDFQNRLAELLGANCAGEHSNCSRHELRNGADGGFLH